MHLRSKLQIFLSDNQPERGSVLVEFAISFAFVVFICFSTISFGSILNNYIKLAQITDEAIRTLAGVPGLADGETVKWSELEPDTIANCTANGSGGTTCGHIVSQARVVFLAEALGLEANDLDIESVFESSTDTVYVRITGNMTGVLSFFGEMPINIEAQGPYLF